MMLRKGFSILELTIVVSFLSLLGMAVAPVATNFFQRNNLYLSVDALVSTLRKAQDYAMDGKDGGVWGVCLTGDVLRLYNGSCVSGSFAEDFLLPPSVSVSGFSDITFSSLRGEPSGVFSSTVSTPVGSRVIVLNGSGGVDIQ